MATASGDFANVLLIGALYNGIERGLSADILASKAADLQPKPVCSSIISASNGRVTDVLAVPTDSVAAQLEHTLSVTPPAGVKIGIIGHHKTIAVAFDLLADVDTGPVVLDLTLSGPSGEDIISTRGRDALSERMNQADVVTVHRRDAELLAGMEIQSLDDAQVAVQRLHKQGAANVLVRCGKIPARHFESEDDAGDFAVDLFYDGNDFGLFEAPLLPIAEQHGASSVLSISLLKALLNEHSTIESLQESKAAVTEALRASVDDPPRPAPDYFWQLRSTGS